MKLYRLSALQKPTCLLTPRWPKIYTKPCRGRKHYTSSANTPVLLPASRLIEEEQLPGYVTTDYYPTRIGEILDTRYRIVCKLGCGTGSTVWLAKDIRYVSSACRVTLLI